MNGLDDTDIKLFGGLVTKANDKQLAAMSEYLEVAAVERQLQKEGWVMTMCRGCNVDEYIRYMEFVTAFNRVERVCRTCAEHYKNLQEVEYQ